MMRFFVSTIVILIALSASADDRAERVRLALHKDDDARKTKVARALAVKEGPCDCHETGLCTCPAKPCDCCRRGLPSYAAQHANALKQGRVLVGFLGCKGSCHGEALCGVQAEAAGKPAIWIGYPKGGQMLVAAELPPVASAEGIRAAIRRAQELMRTPDACPGGFCPACRN